jgi:hypothetical protein
MLAILGMLLVGLVNDAYWLHQVIAWNSTAVLRCWMAERRGLWYYSGADGAFVSSLSPCAVS